MNESNRGIFISIHIADIHFGAFSPKEQYEILHNQYINKIADYPRIDLITILGDLFDKKYFGNSDAIYYSCIFIDELINIARMKNATLCLLHGTYSHDADQLKLFYHYTEDKSVDVRIINTIRFEYIKNVRVLFIPELYGVKEDTYQYYLHHSGWYDYACIHGTFEGSVYDNRVNATGRLFTINDFNMCTGIILMGHVHKAGCFKSYVYYCGNPYRWKFGEEEDKGFLIVMHDLDSGYHEVHFEAIDSAKYITIELNDILYKDPKDVINYINTIKQTNNIDYLKIKFKYPIDGSNKVIINDYYRNNRNVFVEFLNLIEEQRIKNNNTNNDKFYTMINDNSIPPINKFVEYVNMKEGTEFITVERLKEILSESV